MCNDVITATSVNSFKNRLDSFWADQELLYNYKANITGNRGCDVITFHLTIYVFIYDVCKEALPSPIFTLLTTSARQNDAAAAAQPFLPHCKAGYPSQK